MPEPNENQIPVTRWAEAERWKLKIEDVLIRDYVGELADGDTLAALASDLGKMITSKSKLSYDFTFAGSGINDAALLQSLESHISGEEITPRVADLLALRLAGNIQQLQGGFALEPWRGQKHPEWVIAVISDATFFQTPLKKIGGAMLEFSVITGTPAGERFQQFFTERALWQMATRVALIPADRRQRLHHREMVQARVFLRLRAGTELGAEQYRERATLNKYNKTLAARRYAYSSACPRNSKWPCHFCPAGYPTCPLGTHSDNGVQRICAKGHKGWFMPHSKEVYCLECQARKRLASH